MPTPEQNAYFVAHFGVDPDQFATTSLGAPGSIKTLTPDMIAQCRKYLDGHFDALLQPDQLPVKPESYQPSLDGKTSSITGVVQALLPLTLASVGAKMPLTAFDAETIAELTDLVTTRYNSLVLGKTGAALQAATHAAATDVAAQAAEVDLWIRNYLEQNALGVDNIDPDPSGKVSFDQKIMTRKQAIDTTVAAGRYAKLQLGGHNLFTAERVDHLMDDMLVPPEGAELPDTSKRVSIYASYGFIPATSHKDLATGGTSTDPPAQQLGMQFTLELHPDNASGHELSWVAQVTAFNDDKGPFTVQSILTGIQDAWVFSFLDGVLQAGPVIQALVGSSRTQEKQSGNMVWTPTGQVAMGGQVMYAIPGTNKRLQIGGQATAGWTMASGQDATQDTSAQFVLQFKFK